MTPTSMCRLKKSHWFGRTWGKTSSREQRPVAHAVQRAKSVPLCEPCRMFFRMRHRRDVLVDDRNGTVGDHTTRNASRSEDGRCDHRGKIFDRGDSRPTQTPIQIGVDITERPAAMEQDTGDPQSVISGCSQRGWVHATRQTFTCGQLDKSHPVLQCLLEVSAKIREVTVARIDMTGRVALRDALHTKHPIARGFGGFPMPRWGAHVSGPKRRFSTRRLRLTPEPAV